jgi:hypothetical protein
MDAKKQLTTKHQDTHDMIMKLQMEYEDLNVNYQKASNGE